MRAQLPLAITAWNIHGLKDKLEIEDVCNIVQKNYFVILFKLALAYLCEGSSVKRWTTRRGDPDSNPVWDGIRSLG